jgi:hypothetical protein
MDFSSFISGGFAQETNKKASKKTIKRRLDNI